MKAGARRFLVALAFFFPVLLPAGESDAAGVAPPEPPIVYLVPTSDRDDGLQVQRALDLCAASDGFPEDSKFRWTCATAREAESFLQAASPDARKAFLARVKEGRIEVTGLYQHLETTLLSGEELCRAVYAAGRLRREPGFPIDSAMSSRVDGFAWSLPLVLAGAGIRYFSASIREERSRPPVSPGERLFEWRSRGGVGVLVHIDRDQDAIAAGFSDGVEKIGTVLPAYLDRLRAEGYPYPEVLLFARASLDAGAPPEPKLSRAVKEWNERPSNPRLVVATVGQFFRQVTARGRKFPVHEKDWTDVAAPGDLASVSWNAHARRAQDQVAVAESLASAAAVLDPSSPYPRDEIDSVYRNLFSFHAGTPDSALSADGQSSSLFHRASAALVERLGSPGSRLILNPLAWRRDAAPEAKGWIPGLGYGLFQGEARDVPEVMVGEDTLESPFYRVRLNARRTAIASILDKRMGIEILDPESQFGAAEVLSVVGGDWKSPFRLTEGRVVERSAVAGRGKLVFEARGEMVGQVSVGLILYGDLLRTDLEVRIHNDPAGGGEDYLAFPFAGVDPRVRCEVSGGALSPDEDRLPDAARARTVIGRWVTVNSPRLGIAWSSPDAPLLSRGPLPLPRSGERPESPPATMFSRLFGDPPGPGNAPLFRYAIASAAEMGDPAAAQMAWEHATPLIREGPAGIGGDPSSSESFLSIEDRSKGTLITTFKRAEDGDGFVVRIIDFSSDTRQAIIHSAWPIQSAQFADVLETPRGALMAVEHTARIFLKGPGIATVRLKFGK
jgi:alpha-mannosidase